ncbi:MAG: Bug family tripartite tricarboxylate transporter substrate binding protein [Betaproteobacteria bacterium]
MMRPSLARLCALLLLAPEALAAQTADPAGTADFPSRPVRILVGFAPGGGTDITARIIAKRLAELIRQQVVVENRPGGGGVVAMELLANSAPDGHTILLGAVGPFAVTPHMQKVNYDVERDFAPLTMGVSFPNVRVVPATLPVSNLADYLRLARDPAARISYGSSGIGGAGHLAGELLNAMARTEIPHVAYKGGGPAMADLLGGQVPSVMASLPSALPHIRSGRIRALATTGAARARDLPDTPTVAESGFPTYDAVNWYAFVAPARTPPQWLGRLHTELVGALYSKEVVDQLHGHGMEPHPGSPMELAATIRREFAVWAQVVRSAGLAK